MLLPYPSLRQGLIGAWCPSLGASGLTLLDRSGRNGHGTLVNMAGQDNWQASGSGVALNFDGSNDFVTTPTLGPTGNRSASVWFRSSMSLSTGQFRWLVGFGNASTGALFLVGFGTNAVAGTNAFAVTQFGDVLGTAGVLDGVWRHGAVVNDGTRYDVYVDGILRATKTMTTNAASTAVTIGKNPNSLADFFTGLTDDIRIYSRTLTPAEIRLLASRRGIGLSPSAPLHDDDSDLQNYPITEAPNRVHANVDGVWVPGQVRANSSGTWGNGETKVNQGGVWL